LENYYDILTSFVKSHLPITNTLIISALIVKAIVPSSTKLNHNLPIDPLLALRGFACLMVLIAHSHPPKQAIYFQQYDLTWLIFSAGGVAVRIFFCLSGYLMGKAFYPQLYPPNFTGIIKFWRNRAVRIFPLYYFSVLILGLVFYNQLWQPENRQYLVRILTFTYHHRLPIDFNGAFWSLSTEVQFYLFVPLIYICLRDRLTKLNHIVIAFVTLIILSSIIRGIIWLIITSQTSIIEQQIHYFNIYIYTPVLTNLDSFLGGFLVNAIIIQNRKHPKQSFIIAEKLSWFTILFLYIATAYCKYYYQSILLLIAPTITAICVSIFIYLVEANNYPKSCQSSAKFLCKWLLLIFGYLGNLSYGIYIWHYPIVTKMTPIIFSSNNPLTAFFLRFSETIILSTILALVTYYLIELPAAKFKGKTGAN